MLPIDENELDWRELSCSDLMAQMEGALDVLDAGRRPGSGRLYGRPLDDNGAIAFERRPGVLTVERKRELRAELLRVGDAPDAKAAILALAVIVRELLEHMPPSGHAEAVQGLMEKPQNLVEQEIKDRVVEAHNRIADATKHTP